MTKKERSLHQAREFARQFITAVTTEVKALHEASREYQGKRRKKHTRKHTGKAQSHDRSKGEAVTHSEKPEHTEKEELKVVGGIEHTTHRSSPSSASPRLASEKTKGTRQNSGGGVTTPRRGSTHRQNTSSGSPTTLRRNMQHQRVKRPPPPSSPPLPHSPSPVSSPRRKGEKISSCHLSEEESVSVSVEVTSPPTSNSS